MRLDDRDIICEQDYSPLSNAELVAQIEENLEWLRGASLYDTERVMDPARALLARAEAEAAEARATNEALAELAASETERRVALAARVAELEAQLAAQQWRPVTEDDPTPLEHVVIQTRDGADVGWRLPELRHLWQTRRGRTYVNEELRGWLALPPLPPPPAAAQEPTP